MGLANDFNNPDLYAREGFVMLPCWYFIRSAWPKEHIRPTFAYTSGDGMDPNGLRPSHHYFRSPFEGYSPKDLILMFDYYKHNDQDLPVKIFGGTVDVEKTFGQYAMDILVEDLDTLFRRSLTK